MSVHVPTDFGPDSGGRVKGLTIVKPIVYGNIARSFGKKREEDGHTHQWNVYVKPYDNEDMFAYVKKIHFKLHDSYANPNRIITKPPYEITETGWGEFEVVIKIYFHDPTERPVTLYHILKLFQTPMVDSDSVENATTHNTSTPTAQLIDNKKGIVSESYDEIVFQEPTQLMQYYLVNIQKMTNGIWKHDTNFNEKISKNYENILNAKTNVKIDITLLKDKLKIARETIGRFKNELSKVQTTSAQNT